MKQRAIIIIGGGIGGLTLARFLARDGQRVTVIERAKNYLSQGQAIGFRGVGLQVMDQLGLRQRVEREGYNHHGVASYSFGGSLLRKMSYADHAEDVGGVVVTLRGQLHAALVENLPPEIEVKFGLSPTGLREQGEKVFVTLSDQSTLEADLVIGADGANSAVRKMILPNIQPESFGNYAAMLIDTPYPLDPDEVASFYGWGRMVIFFPVTPQKVSAVIYQDAQFPAPPAENTPEAWAPFLRRYYGRGAAKVVRQVFGDVKAGDAIYHDAIRLIPPTQAVLGRIALVGDAGYCPSFFSGNGAGVAAAGAYCLARCLAKYDDDREALRQYERLILPFAAEYQANANRMKNFIISRSPVVNTIRPLIQRFGPDSMFRGRARAHYRGDVQITEWVT